MINQVKVTKKTKKRQIVVDIPDGWTDVQFNNLKTMIEQCVQGP